MTSSSTSNSRLIRAFHRSTFSVLEVPAAHDSSGRSSPGLRHINVRIARNESKNSKQFFTVHQLGLITTRSVWTTAHQFLLTM